MKRIESIPIGTVFGNLTVLAELPTVKGARNIKCQCSCGALRIVRIHALKSGNTKSCGCLKLAIHTKRLTTHGLVRHPLYPQWKQMRKRCSNKNSPNYPNYGGRGIKVCKRWHSFENFLADVGERPFDRATLDRINNNGDYEPSNVRWASRKEQCRNTRTNRILTHAGLTLTTAEWAEKTGIGWSTLRNRLNKLRWTVERTLTTKPRKFKNDNTNT